jgi:hypothetical protein
LFWLIDLSGTWPGRWCKNVPRRKCKAIPSVKFAEPEVIECSHEDDKGKGKDVRNANFAESEVIECSHVDASNRVALPTALSLGRALAEDPSTITNFYTVGNIGMASYGSPTTKFENNVEFLNPPRSVENRPSYREVQ